MKKQRFILVHGYNVRDGGSGTIDRIKKHLEKPHGRNEVIEYDTGWRGLISVRFENKERAKELSAIIEPDDILIGHSDGCNLIDQALHNLTSFHPATVRCVYFNPALNRSAPLARCAQECIVFYTDTDKVVWLSKHLLNHPWGQMGKLGYGPKKGQKFDPRYKNISYERLGHHRLGHSGVFKSPIALKDCYEKIVDELDLLQ